MKGSSATLLNYVMTGHWMISPPRVFGGSFTVEQSLICKTGFVTKRHNQLRDLDAELLSTVFSYFKTEPVLYDISGVRLRRGPNKPQDARLDIHALGGP